MWPFLCNECLPPVPQQWLQFLVSAQGVPQRSMMKFHSAVLHPGNGCSQTQVLPKRGEMNEERLWSGGHFCEVGEGWEKSHFYCLLSERARVYLNWGDSQINQKKTMIFFGNLERYSRIPASERNARLRCLRCAFTQRTAARTPTPRPARRCPPRCVNGAARCGGAEGPLRDGCARGTAGRAEPPPWWRGAGCGRGWACRLWISVLDVVKYLVA